MNGGDSRSQGTCVRETRVISTLISIRFCEEPKDWLGLWRATFGIGRLAHGPLTVGQRGQVLCSRDRALFQGPRTVPGTRDGSTGTMAKDCSRACPQVMLRCPRGMAELKNRMKPSAGSAERLDLHEKKTGSQCCCRGCDKGYEHGSLWPVRRHARALHFAFVLLLVLAFLGVLEADASSLLPPDAIRQGGSDEITLVDREHRQVVVSGVRQLRGSRRADLTLGKERRSGDLEVEGRMLAGDGGHVASSMCSKRSCKHRILRTRAAYMKPRHTPPTPVLTPVIAPLFPYNMSMLAPEGVTKLAVQLMQAMNTSGNGSVNGSSNVVFSPLSVFGVLAMVTGGAGGNTLSQLLAALNTSDVYRLSDDLRRALPKPTNDSNSTASLAAGGNDTMVYDFVSNLWVDSNFPLSSFFTNLTNSTFNAVPQAVDFAVSAESIREKINDWVANTTHGKILDLLPPGSLDALTRLVLVNALYFKAPWATKFDPALTRPRPFMLSSRVSVNVPTMKVRGLEGSVHSMCKNEGASANFSVLRLPYAMPDAEDEEMVTPGAAMYIFLPTKADGLADLVAELTPDQLSRCLSMSLSPSSEVRISELRIPRFRVASDSLLLKDALKSIGIVDAFDPEYANFTAMSDVSTGLYVSQVFHKAFVEVNEEGSEAAAATGATVMVRSAPVRNRPVNFIVDRPFLYIIQDASGSIVIMGQVYDPRM
ncbi:hypothetical protein CBR_g20349 [Chara braunii]|uniref:Serpin domain-containing protein n=1 Tax=Chara braunii TaxID=69332 RepID=A0A388JU32_CHABU|nr:hypothetical protein CBR_g20349 [Chara braunii]|eukprot:GBG61314.1 hypothetical protein CBR_g20349 [Chara braunii]